MKPATVKTLQYQITMIERRFYVVTAVLVIFMGVTLVYLTTGFGITKSPVASNQPAVSELKTNPIVKKDYQISISSFYNNTAISEVGFQLELKKQSISSKNTTNCFTPTPPPIKNGCSFVLRPYASGIQSQGSYLNNLIFKANMQGDDKIAIDIFNSQKNEIVTSLGNIEGKQSEYSVKIPSVLNQNENILVRLWPQRGNYISIDEILIEHFSIENLQPASLVFPADIMKDYKNKKMSIYIDNDKNGLFSKETDLLWICNDGFPGIKPVVLTGNDPRINLVRDDSCVRKNTPTSWKTDKGLSALAPYNYLAVIENKQGSLDVYPFEVTKDTTEYELK